jgi:tyrosine-specific transport protein
MDFKLVGSILLVAGNAIGAGMLALPIATAQVGFMGSLILLCVGWAVMTAGALLLLEVNLWLPKHSNIISMAKATLGPLGEIVAWITYFLLLYSLLCAYIAGGSDLLHNLLFKSGINLPQWLAAILFTLMFSTVVFFGIHAVDYTNRGLMTFKFASYFFLIFLLMPFVTAHELTVSHLSYLTSTSALTVTITSFGFAAIVPSLRVYFGGDAKKLILSIVIGSFIPLVCYILWNAVVMGVVPFAGEGGLLAILHSKTSTSDLVNTLSISATGNLISLFTKLFTSVCLLTSFLGVALSLADFLADGLQLEKIGMQRFFIHFLTFLPPLVIVLFFPNAFIKALEYAGIYCIILLVLLPAWMAWRGRYHHQIDKGFMMFGGKWLLIFLIFFSYFVIVKGFSG